MAEDFHQPILKSKKYGDGPAGYVKCGERHETRNRKTSVKDQRQEVTRNAKQSLKRKQNL